MKSIIKVIITIFLLTVLPSCLQNNGHIGSWYGMWKLTSLTIDGQEDPEYEGNVFWKFPTGVIQMDKFVDDGYIASTGTWKDKDNILELTYDYYDDSTPEPEKSQKYTTLKGMHLPSTGVINLEINKRPSSSMQLTYRSKDGKTYVYKFKKW